MNGFMLDFNGPPEYVERIYHAAMAELHRVIEEDRRERERWMIDLGVSSQYAISRAMPVTGTITIRKGRPTSEWGRL